MRAVFRPRPALALWSDHGHNFRSLDLNHRDLARDGGNDAQQINPIASLGLAAALAGCNTTDALIPQVDVGEGTFRSPPVTQSDLDSMSRRLR